MYAFGITLFEVFACAEPYAAEPDALSVLQRVADASLEPPFRPALPPHTPPLFRELCRRCWHPERAVRPSFAQIALEIKSLDMPGISNALLLTRQGHKRMGLLQDRQGALISRVFPARVAAALLEDKTVDPQAFDSVTIFFSDIVGFTDISARLRPEQVMHLLDRLYTLFDEITDRHGLFKVETIG